MALSARPPPGAPAEETQQPQGTRVNLQTSATILAEKPPRPIAWDAAPTRPWRGWVGKRFLSQNGVRSSVPTVRHAHEEPLSGTPFCIKTYIPSTGQRALRRVTGGYAPNPKRGTHKEATPAEGPATPELRNAVRSEAAKGAIQRRPPPMDSVPWEQAADPTSENYFPST